ncbi:TRAF3-interacting protein 1-like [Aulostomus maculatus]
MNEAVIKATQDTLGEVIKKPPLTEKLLSRPPFRYLHDIFSEVIKTTGFMKGLYDENEMQSDNVTEKDTKIAFLQKAIDVVMLVSGEPLTAKPSRIVAGLQPERTNEMLQAIAKCCLNKLSSEEAVKRVLAGEKLDMKTKASTSRAKDKENREGRERHLDRQERRKSAEATGNGDHKDLHQPRELESRHRDREKHHRHERERSDRERDRGQQRRSKFAGHDDPDSKGDGEAQVAQGPVPQENGDAAGSTVPSIRASSTRRMPRPSSARPAPPRVKPQDTATGGTPAERQSSAKPSKAGIMDGKQPSEVKEDDDEQFIVEDAVSSPTDAPEKHLKPAHKLSSGPKHGGFEKKVLETRNDHQSSQSSTTSEDQSLVSEEAQKKEQDLFIQEMEQLLSSIQTVCCSILPLREIMDHLQEDMEAMQAELHTWQRENKKYTEALQQEQRVTDEAMEPLQAELAELEQLIKDQQDKICITKCNILKNDEKINKMLTGMNCSIEI